MKLAWKWFYYHAIYCTLAKISVTFALTSWDHNFSCGNLSFDTHRAGLEIAGCQWPKAGQIWGMADKNNFEMPNQKYNARQNCIELFFFICSSHLSIAPLLNILSDSIITVHRKHIEDNYKDFSLGVSMCLCMHSFLWCYLVPFLVVQR